MTDHRLTPERRDRFSLVLTLVLLVLAGEVAATLWRAW
jgi:hypothetical protein